MMPMPDLKVSQTAVGVKVLVVSFLIVIKGDALDLVFTRF